MKRTIIALALMSATQAIACGGVIAPRVVFEPPQLTFTMVGTLDGCGGQSGDNFIFVANTHLEKLDLSYNGGTMFSILNPSPTLNTMFVSVPQGVESITGIQTYGGDRFSQNALTGVTIFDGHFTDSNTTFASHAPEPETYALMLSGLLLLGLKRRRAIL